MKQLALEYSPESRQHLTAIYDYIANSSGYPSRALTFVAAIEQFCEGLAEWTDRGTERDDLRPGLRIIGYRRRVEREPDPLFRTLLRPR